MDEIKVVKYKSKEYLEAIRVRYLELRKPIGMKYTKKILSGDKDDTHIVFILEERVVATLILTHLNKNEVQLRQFAVLKEYQFRGIGAKLYDFTESYIKQNSYNKLVLNARSNVTDFYQKKGLIIDGDEYMSTRTFIPHYKMFKKL
ncbi:MAG: GNAT family N-acetyltransferase [Spirochaetaceae bacterium]